MIKPIHFTRSLIHSLAIAAFAILLLMPGRGWGQTAFNMSSGNYSLDFSDIANWTNNFTSGTGASNWGSVAVNATGAIPDGIKITVSSATFSTTTSGGVQKGTGNLLFLSTGTTSNGNSVAADLYLNFTGRTVGTLTFDYACVFNSTGNRGGTLKVYTSTNGTTWTELSSASVSVVNNVASSGTKSTLALPAAFSGSATARIRFYQYADAVGSTGSRPKISIDNIAVTSTAVSNTAPTLSLPTATSIATTTATLGATVTSDGGAQLTERGTVWGTSATPTGNVLAEGGTAVSTFSHARTGLTPNTFYYYRGYAVNSAGTGYSPDGSFYTLANVPSAPTVNNPTASSLDVAVNANSNPATTEFAIRQLSTSNYVQADGTLGTTEVWATAATWGTKTVSGLSAETEYSFEVKARNGAAVETVFGAAASATTLSSGALSPPALTAAAGATVDAAFNVTFPDDAASQAWVSAEGTTITIGGTPLTAGYAINNGIITFTPSASSPAGLLQTAGVNKAIVISKTGYTNATVSQTIAAGAATKLGIKTQPAAPATNGAALATQPEVYIQDQYGNTTTSTATVDAAVGEGEWTLGGGSTSVAGIAGAVTFSGLTATSSATVTGATITFSSGSLTGVSSGTFNIPAPIPVITINGTLTTFGEQCLSTATTEKSYTVSGSNLTANIIITAPTHFQVSTTSGSGFGSSVTLSPSAGSVSNATIYVRFLPTIAGATGIVNITHTSTGAATQNQPVQGTGTTTPSGMTTSAVSTITATSATSGCGAFTAGGANITAKGVCWSTTSGPTITDSKTSDGTGATSFTSSLTGLSPATTYYVRAYATNNCGTSYGTEVSFKTLTTPVTVPYTQNFEGTTTEWTLATTGTNKWAVGSATNNGGTKALYISNDNGTSNSYTVTSAQSGTDASVRLDLTGLTVASLAFDWKSAGESTYDYGEVYINTGASDVRLSSSKEFVGTTNFATKRISLTPYVGNIVTLKFRWVNDGSAGTDPPFVVDNMTIVASDPATLTTTAATGIGVNSATTGGTITVDGGSAVIARGVCYGTTTNPSLAGSKTIDGSGTGNFTSTLAGLIDNTLYYVRAYATNSAGTAYGNEITFTTSTVPAPTAAAATNISSTSFNTNWGAVTGALGGYLLDVSTSATFGTTSPATLNEGFESGMPSTYTSGTYTLGSGSWSFVNAGKSTNPANNHSSSAGGCQLQGGTSASATSPSLNTVGTVTFWGIRGTNATSVSVQKIVSGVTTTVQTIPLTTTMTQYNVDVNESSSAVQIKFLNGANVAYIDDISIGYTTITPSFVSGYNAKAIAGQATVTAPISGLAANTNYYYRLRAIGSNSTSANSNVISVTTHSNPSEYAMTGGGAYCAGSGGVAVGLAGSQVGVSYTLIKDGTPTATVVAGTGSAISFGIQANGVYTASGTADGSVPTIEGTTAMTSTATVTLNALPTAVITGDATICAGSSTNLSVALTGTQPWSVTFTDGTTPVTVSDITSSPKTIAVSPSTATTYTLTAVSDANCIGTSYTGSAAITVEPTPVAGTLTKTPDALSVCEGNSVSATLTAGTGGNGNDELQYRTNNGSEWTSWLDYTSGASILTTGLTNVEIQTRRLATTCSSSAYTTVSWIVNSNLPVSVSIESSDADNTICDGTSVIFTATPTNGGASPTYQWKLNGSYVGSGTNTYTNDALVDQDKVSVVLTSNATCASGSPATSNEIATTVNPNQPVSVSISSSDVDNTICDGTSVIFTATPTNGGASPSYQWKLNGSNVGSGTNTYTTATLVDQDKVTVVLTSNATCATGSPATSNEIATTVNTAITPTFAAVGPYCAGASIPALPTTSTNGITGTWSPAINNTATTEYTFTPTAGQCATTATLTITINSNTTPTFAAVGPYCAGASIDALPTTSTNGITGTWSPVINNTTTTEYTFTPTAGQCATTATLTITINSSPTADAGTGVGIGLGVAYTLNGTATNYNSVLWTIETGGSSTDGIFDDATKLDAAFTGNALGTIKLRLTATGGCGVATSDITMVVLPTEPVNWKGTAANNNWNNPDNWFSASVPDENTDVFIPANAPKFPTVTATAACRDIEIAAGASLIDNANYLTVHGTATVNHTAIAPSRWHLISSPVSNAKSGMYTGQYLRNFITSTGKYEPVYSTTEVLTPAKGFALWTTASNSTAYVGSTLNSGTQSFTLSGAGDRWNLVGNPYPSSIDWSIAAGFDKSNIDDAIYVVNETGWNTYVDGVGTPGTFGPQIAPTQGFFVRANSTSGGTFQINNNARVHNNTPFYKKADGAVPNLVRLKVSGNGYADEAVVRFKPEATADFDGNYDAVKMFGDVAAAAQLYSLGTTPLAINSLPETELVAVGIHVGTAGSYTLTAPEINDLNYVTLEDAVTGIFTPLSGSSYTFDATPGDYNNRFKLHFSMLSVEEAQKATAEVYSYQHTIYINIKDQQKGDIFVYNISGQLVKTIPSARGNNEIKVAVGGNYIVKVVGKDNTSVKKVWIQQ